MNGTQGLITELYEARVRHAQAVHHLTVLEAQRVGLKLRLFEQYRGDTNPATGKPNSESRAEDLVRATPEYVTHLQAISGQEHARDLLAAECERLKYTVQLQLAAVAVAA